MLNLRFVFSSLILACLLVVPSAWGQQLNHDAPDEAITEGVLHIKITEQAKLSVQVAQSDGIAQMGIASIDQLSAEYGVDRMERIFPTNPRYAERHAKWGLDRWYRVYLDTPEVGLTRDAVNAYHADANIEMAEHALEKESLHNPVEAISTLTEALSKENSEDDEFIPDDPLYGQQWHFDNTGQSGGTPGADISLPQAHTLQTGASEVVVQVVDSGIELDHPDLEDNLWVNPCEEEDGTDTCGNGYVDDVYGYNFADGNSNVDAGGDSHGIHVSGTIAATNNNGEGVASVAGGDGTPGSGVRIMTGRTFANSVSGFAEAIVYGADNGAVITNHSWGYTEPGVFEQTVLDAMDYFTEEAGGPDAPMNGGIVIAAAGNENDGGRWYPGYHETAMAVSATDRNDRRASFSNYGEWVDIAAPGSNITSTVSTSQGGYDSYNGTSMAAPHIAGVAALIVSEQTGLTPQQVRQGLVATGDIIETDQPTGPRTNAYAALRTLGVAPAAITDLSIVAPSVDMRVDPGDVVELQWTAPGDAGDEGRAFRYDLRYSTEGPIETDADFEAATPVDDLPAPQEAGNIETVSAEGIPFDSEVYFAIRTIDPFGEVSDLSNSPSTVTRVMPELALDPEAIEMTLVPNEERTQSVSLENAGPSQSRLEYEIAEDSDFITDVTPQSGILSGGEEATVTVTVRSGAADFGSYQDEITISTNEANPTERTLPLTLAIEPGDPEIIVEPETLAFGGVLEGNSTSQTFSVQNLGGDVLEIGEITSSSNAFTVSEEGPLEVPYDGSVTEIEVTFAPSSVEAFEESVRIESNAANMPSAEVAVEGEGLPAPEIGVDPAAFDVTIDAFSTREEPLVLSNSGDGALTYQAFFALDGTEVPTAEIAAPFAGRATSLSSQGVGDLRAVEPPEGPEGMPVPYQADDFVYQLDDGAANTNIIFGSAADVMWLNAFEVVEGATMITSLATAWGYQLPEGTDAKLLLYDDPVGNADPRDAELLHVVETTVQNPGSNDFTIEAIPPTRMEGTFFIAALYRGATDTAAGPLDTNESQGASWVIGHGTEGGFDIEDLGSNNFGPGRTDDFGISGNWLLRADGAPDLVAIAPNEGTVSPNASEDLQVTFKGTDASPGAYSGNIRLVNNDPQEPVKLVPTDITIEDAPALVINEILADPPAGEAGDANGDGTRDASDDEFIEIYNTSNSAVDISGYTIEDDAGLRHTVPDGTVLDPGVSLTVFSGGTPTGIPGLVQTASEGKLSLNNDGDTVTLNAPSGTAVTVTADGGTIASVTYGSEGGNDQSLVRSPEFTGPFVQHTMASGSGAAFSPGRQVDGTPLPVELARFTAQQESEAVALTWQTASETNNAGFEIQRQQTSSSSLGPTWERISFVEGAGTTDEPQSYRFRDTAPPFADSLVYRLKQIDTDGTEAFSDPVVIKQGLGAEVQLATPFPNPVRQQATVRYIVPEGEAQPVRLQVYNVLGQRVATLVDEAKAPGREEITLDASRWASGTYFLRLQVGGVTKTQRLTVVR